MARHIFGGAAIWILAMSAGSGLALGQGPTIDPNVPSSPGAPGSMLGSQPGGGAALFDNSPGANQGTLGGRAGPSQTRAPASITTPGGTGTAAYGTARITAPVALPNAEPPVYGSLDFPAITDYEGPVGGMTLDDAIATLLRDNLFLRSAAFEIPQADADILTASLRANPVFYADSQLVPYGAFSRQRPGGQTQYDVNISYPLDVSRKRKNRTIVATRAKQVLEQQYRDAVRLQIDNLYTVYVDVLSARATLHYAEASVEGLDKFLVPTRDKFEKKAIPEQEYLRVVIQRETAELGRRDAEEQLRKNKRSLANILNIDPTQADAVEVRSPLKDVAPPAPSTDELIQIALENRPDLIGYRLGIHRAEADVKLAYANRYQDVYLLLQPYTFQDNQPNGLKSATSYAFGVTIPIPIYNRNQGNIQKAKINVTQTKTQLEQINRQVITDVQIAEREYIVSLAAVQRFDTVLNPYAKKILARAEDLLKQGATNTPEFLAARNEFVAIVKQYLDAMVRHRRAMLDLNTAVGRRILP